MVEAAIASAYIRLAFRALLEVGLAGPFLAIIALSGRLACAVFPNAQSERAMAKIGQWGLPEGTPIGFFVPCLCSRFGALDRGPGSRPQGRLIGEA